MTLIYYHSTIQKNEGRIAKPQAAEEAGIG